MESKVTPSQLSPAVFEAFRLFINQRAGLDPRNYFSDWRDKDGRRAFNSESRSITKDGQRARKALAMALSYPFDAQALINATSAFSGRLQIVTKGTEKAFLFAIDYCTGQYWPTEYRKAAATVLESYVEAIRPKTVSGRIPASIAELKDMARAAGSHFFDRGNVRFFNSRTLPSVYSGPGGVFFVTSEQYDDRSARRFTVRKYNPETADISSFGEFNKMSQSEAQALARRAAKASPALCPTCAGDGVKHGQPCWNCQKQTAVA